MKQSKLFRIKTQ